MNDGSRDLGSMARHAGMKVEIGTGTPRDEAMWDAACDRMGAALAACRGQPQAPGLRG